MRRGRHKIELIRAGAGRGSRRVSASSASNACVVLDLVPTGCAASGLRGLPKDRTPLTLASCTCIHGPADAAAATAQRSASATTPSRSRGPSASTSSRPCSTSRRSRTRAGSASAPSTARATSSTAAAPLAHRACCPRRSQRDGADACSRHPGGQSAGNWSDPGQKAPKPVMCAVRDRVAR